MPEGTADWDVSGAYIEKNEKERPKIGFGNIFNRNAYCYEVMLTKNQAEVLLNSIDDYKIKPDALMPEIIFLDINKMEFVKRSEAMKLRENAEECIMAFSPKYLKDTLDFIVCSDCADIQLLWNNKTITSSAGKLGPLIMKSDRLYTAILPVCIDSYFEGKYQ